MPELEKEDVPTEWKDHLTQIIANRHKADAQPAVKSPEEFIWAVRFVASIGTSRTLGRAPEPKGIAPKISGPDIGLDPWQGDVGVATIDRSSLGQFLNGGELTGVHAPN